MHAAGVSLDLHIVRCCDAMSLPATACQLTARIPTAVARVKATEPSPRKTRVRNHGLGSHLGRKSEHDTGSLCCYIGAQMVNRYPRTDPARKAEAYRIYLLQR